MIVVLGGQGQLGRALVRLADGDGVALVALGRSEADIAERPSLMRSLKAARPSLIVNAAAFTNVDAAEGDPEGAYRVNATGAGNVAAIARDLSVPLIHISTDYVFSGDKSGPYAENDAVAPINVYGASKEDGERVVRNTWPSHLILRTAWLFSSGGKGFLQSILRLAREKPTIDVVADQYGSPTRADDLARAILIAAGRAHEGQARWGTYHLAGQGRASRFDFAVAIAEAQAAFTARRPVINPVSAAAFPMPARRPTNTALDSTRFADAFGYRADDWRTATGKAVREFFAAPGAAAAGTPQRHRNAPSPDDFFAHTPSHS